MNAELDVIRVAVRAMALCSTSCRQKILIISGNIFIHETESYSLPVVASKRVTDNLDKTVVLANVSNEDRTQVAFKIVQVKIEPNILLLPFLTPTGMLDLV